MPAATDLAPSFHCLSKHGCRCRAVAGEIVRPLGDFAHHLSAHVLELIVKLNFLSYCDAILGDTWGAETFFEHDIAPLWTKGHFHRIGEDVDSAQHTITCIA